MKKAIILFLGCFLFISNVYAEKDSAEKRKEAVLTQIANHYAKLKKPEKNGPVTLYYQNGKIKTQGFFEHSKRHGEWKFYKNGVYNGSYQTYFDDGQIQEERFYINGVLDGLEKIYYRNGKLKSEITYNASNNTNCSMDIMGNIPYKICHPSGSYKTYYENGQLKEEGSYVNGNREGICKVYYKNGQLKQQGLYKNDKRDGLFQKYYENGQLQLEASYKDDKYSGSGQSFYENGALQSEWDAENTAKIGPLDIDEGGSGWFKEYDKSSRILMNSGQYQKGKRDGEWYQSYIAFCFKTVYENGKVISHKEIACDLSKY